jgi:cytochrome c5
MWTPALAAAVNCGVKNKLFGDPANPPKSTAPLGTRLSTLIVIALFSICALADSGADIYKAHCSACHATSGAGDTMLGKNLKLRSLSSPEVQQQSDEELFSITSKGKNRMPAYGRKLSQQQIEAVVKHIRSLKR